MKGTMSTARSARRYRLIASLVLVVAILLAYTYQGPLDVAKSREVLTMRDNTRSGHLTITNAEEHDSAVPGVIRTKTQVSPESQAPTSVSLCYVMASPTPVRAEDEYAPQRTSTTIFIPPEA